MKINIFLTCFNESLILPSTIKHYKALMPSCSITIYDNESTDNSIELAKGLGCEVVTFSTGNNFDEKSLTIIRNTCWKNISDGWIIVADMDEWLCITEEELQQEVSNGTTIISTRGVNMIGESIMADLSDITLSEITKCKDEINYSKRACFFRSAIVDMNFTGGSHFCFPNGQIKYSLKSYIYKHMNYLGLPYLTEKYIRNFKRSANMRTTGAGVHYKDNIDEIKELYLSHLNNSYEIDNIPNKNWTFIKGVDSNGYDIKSVGRLPVDELIKIAESTPGCIGFNTLGYLKSGSSLELNSTPWIKTFSHDGIYFLQTSKNLS